MKVIGYNTIGGLTSSAAALAACALFAFGCNLGFDPSQYGPLPVTDGNNETNNGGFTNNGTAGTNNDENNGVNNETIPRGCRDVDEDGYGWGLDCPKDQLDCDDDRSVVNPDAPEVCDNLDNDCDMMVDEGDDGNPLRMACYTGNQSELGHPATSCQRGFRTCTDGKFPPETADNCIGQILPTQHGELDGVAKCDGRDNDCSGDVDPNCICPALGAEEPCYAAGSPELAGVGTCAMGTRRCFRGNEGDLVWGECQGDVAPGDESCENPGEDNDCNGVTDDVPEVGTACQTTEPGRCRDGQYVCESETLTCTRAREPLDEETCNGIDDDCDNMIDEEVSNACGGCGLLGGEVGGACGVCGDGVYACNEAKELECVGARGLNACNGCSTLQNQPGQGCGTCGVYACDGTDAVRCNEGVANACGACGPVEGEDDLGTSCGECGEWVCNDAGTGIRCENRPFNQCGGCAELTGTPGEPCGPCLDGRYECNGTNALLCQGARPLNVCGGCNDLSQTVGDTCGQECGRFECDDTNVGYLTCVDPGFNACGGCGEILNPIGDPCGVCGQYECVDGNTTCVDGGNNSCGGCTELPGVEGEGCGQCGTWVCQDQETIVCDDPGLNACDGCGDLGGQAPGDSCGSCGSLVCNLAKTALQCADQPFNDCGGCGAIEGASPGTACGICGTTMCDGGNSTTCDDPGLNSCLGCSVLTSTPGTLCDDDCAYVSCNSSGETTCESASAVRACNLTHSTLLRVLSFAVHNKDCTVDADCGPGFRCVSLDDGYPTTPDTCSPAFRIELQSGLSDVLIPYTFVASGATDYYANDLLNLATGISVWHADQDVSSDPPLFTRPLSIGSGTEVSLALVNSSESCVDATDCTNQANTTCVNNLCRTTCASNADCSGSLCLDGLCRFYDVERSVDQNVPVENMGKIRLMNAHPGFQNVGLRLLVQEATGRSGGQVVWEDTGDELSVGSAVPLGAYTPYTTVPPGNYRLKFVDQNGFDLATFTASFPIKASEVHTIYFFGRPNGALIFVSVPTNIRSVNIINLSFF